MSLLLEAAEFPPEVSSVRRARSFVRDALTTRDVVADTPVLLVSELATNAVMHARTDFAVRLFLDDDADTVRVEVEDANERPPMIGHTPPEATSGRGLHLVQRLASAWGVEGRNEGKVVWFAVPVEDRDRRSAFAC